MIVLLQKSTLMWRLLVRWRDRQTDRQTDRQAGRQAGRQTDRQTETDRQRVQFTKIVLLQEFFSGMFRKFPG